MAFDEGLAERVREALEEHGAFTERRMFGGLAFMLGGNMCVGIVGEDLMVRVGPAAYEEALARPHAREMDFTGKPMKGMVFVASEGFESDDELQSWVRRGVEHARSLPPR